MTPCWEGCRPRRHSRTSGEAGGDMTGGSLDQWRCLCDEPGLDIHACCRCK